MRAEQDTIFLRMELSSALEGLLLHNQVSCQDNSYSVGGGGASGNAAASAGGGAGSSASGGETGGEQGDVQEGGDTGGAQDNVQDGGATDADQDGEQDDTQEGEQDIVQGDAKSGASRGSHSYSPLSWLFLASVTLGTPQP